jgi:hypothetical protein
VARDAKVVADRARGLTWPTIADRHALSERQCRSIWSEWVRERPLEPTDPRDALREAVAQLDATIEDTALFAETIRLPLT